MLDPEMLTSVPLFAGLSHEELELVASVAARRTYRRGTVIFFEHEPGDALYIIETGQVRIYRLAEDGREKTLALLSDGDFFGEMALIDEEPRSAIAEVTEDASLLAIHKRDFDKLFFSHPRIALSIVRGLSRRLRQTTLQLMDAVFLDVRSRVIRLLLNLSEEHGKNYEGGRLIDMKLTHQAIANMVGTSRESVTRVLTELQDEKALNYVERKLLWIDPDALQAMLGSAGE